MSALQNRPKTSVPKASQAAKYFRLPYTRATQSAAGPNFKLISSKFTRKKFKEDFGMDANTETAYNTRNGMLNSSIHKSRPGGNGYFSILKQRKQIEEVMAQETDIDRKVREMKLEFLEVRKPLLDQSVSSESADRRQSAFLTSVKTQSRLSNTPSVALVRPQTQSCPAKNGIPISFSHPAIRCQCEPEVPCTCGKRELSAYFNPPPNATREKIDEILDTCKTMSKESMSISQEMSKNLKNAKKRLQVCHRHTKTIMMGIQRAKYFSLRKKFQLATRVRSTQRHDKFQNSTQICIPADIEEAAESDPSIFISNSAARQDGYSR